jgi:hypothetical protein
MHFANFKRHFDKKTQKMLQSAIFLLLTSKAFIERYELYFTKLDKIYLYKSK